MSNNSVEKEGDQEDNEEKLDFGMIGYSMKLHYMQMIAQTAPRILPKYSPDQSSRGGKRKKVFCSMWASGSLIAELDCDVSVLIPFGKDGNPSLPDVKKALLSAGKSKACVQYLTVFGKLDEDIRSFDLPNLGLRMYVLADPRPKVMLESTDARINIPLANDDNRLACLMLLADKDFDLTLIQDIFGPALFMLRSSPNPKDLKIKHLQSFNQAYFGLSRTFQEFLKSATLSLKFGSFMFQPMPDARRTYKKQLKGKASPTDLSAHAPMSSNPRQSLFFSGCGKPGCFLDESKNKDNLMLCARCKGIYYCSETCQREDWDRHQKFCKKDSKGSNSKGKRSNC